MFKKALLTLTALLSSSCGTLPSPTIIPPGCTEVQVQIENFAFKTCKEALDERVIREFDLIRRVKNFGKETLGYEETGNYKEYRDGKFFPKKTQYLLFVAPKNMLPEKWENFKTITKKGDHFKDDKKPTIIWSLYKDDLKDELQKYESKGYETFWRSFDSYGGGCALTPKLIKAQMPWKISVVLHEDWHYNFAKRTVGNPDPNINESTASFLGYVGAIEFSKFEFGIGSKEHKGALKQFEKKKKHADVVIRYHRVLRAVFNSNLSEKDKDRERDRLLDEMEEEGFGMGVMQIWDAVPYTKYFMLWNAVYEKQGSNLKNLNQILRGLPNTDELAVKFLEKFL